VIDRNDLIDRVAKMLQEPVRVDPAFDRAVMAEISRSRAALVIGWLRRPRTLSVSPLGAVPVLVAVIVAVIAGGRLMRPDAPTPGTSAVPGLASGLPIQFVIVAPGAESVSIVGDFNDWDLGATPLIRDDGDGLWSVSVPLEAGRYRYSFVVDGTEWRDDPRSAPAMDDEFGRPNSVITIGGGP
jgi:hypothetical protein